MVSHQHSSHRFLKTIFVQFQLLIFFLLLLLKLLETEDRVLYECIFAVGMNKSFNGLRTGSLVWMAANESWREEWGEEK